MINKQTLKAPPLCEKTLKWLDALCPERSASRGESLESIWITAGKRELINKALMVLEDQQNMKDQ